MIRFTVHGEPVAAARAKYTNQRGRVWAYDPQKSRNYKQYVRVIAKLAGINEPKLGPIKLSVQFYRSIPQTWTKKKQKLAADGTLKPTTKPDLDNLIKAVQDALNGIAYADDRQIIEMHISKHYSTEPRVEIAIEEDASG